jgi:hypothetical protein
MGCRGVFYSAKPAVRDAIVACLHKPFMHVSSNVKGKHAVNSIHYNFFSFLAHLLLIIQAGMPRTHYLGGKMKTRTKATILAGVFMITAALPVTVLAGKNGAVQGQTQRNENRNQHQQRLRDGSCVNRTGPASQEKQRNENRNQHQQRLRDGSCVDPVK